MQGAGPTSRASARAGFTLIEMLAVTTLTAVMMLYAVNFYREITRATEAATAQTRDGRRAALAWRAAGFGDPEFGGLCLARQRDVARRGLVPAGCDTDERLVDFLLRQPHRV